MKVKNLDAAQLKVEAALVADKSPSESQQNVKKLLYFLFLFYIIMYLPTTFYTYIYSCRMEISWHYVTVPFASKFVDFPSNFVEVVRNERTAPRNAKWPTGKSLATDSVTRTGAAVTSTAKRTSTMKSFQSQTRVLVSEPRDSFLPDSESSSNPSLLILMVIHVLIDTFLFQK